MTNKEKTTGKGSKGNRGFSTCTITFNAELCYQSPFYTQTPWMIQMSINLKVISVRPDGPSKANSFFTGCARDKLDGEICQQERLGNLIIASTNKREGWNRTIVGGACR